MQKNFSYSTVKAISLLENEKNYRNHVIRLAKIAGDKKPFLGKQKTLDDHNHRLQVCQDAQQRRTAQEQTKIQRENGRILDKLLNINLRGERKTSPIKKPTNPEVTQTGFKNGRARSLNMVNRKLDILKIVNENVKLTERIVFQESALSKEKFAREYRKHKEYSDRIRKFRIKEDRTLLVGQGGLELSPGLRIKNQISYLPPLQSTFFMAASPPPRTLARSSSVPRIPGENRLATTSIPGSRARRDHIEAPDQYTGTRDIQTHHRDRLRKEFSRSQSVSAVSRAASGIILETSARFTRVKELDEGFQGLDDQEDDFDAVVAQDQLKMIDEVDASRKPGGQIMLTRGGKKEFSPQHSQDNEYIVVQDDSGQASREAGSGILGRKAIDEVKEDTLSEGNFQFVTQEGSSKASSKRV